MVVRYLTGLARKTTCTRRNAPKAIAMLASLAAIAILPRSIFGTDTNGELTMAIDIKAGGNVRITIQKTVNRDAARKTLERLFMQDKYDAAPIEHRSANFKELPK